MNAFEPPSGDAPEYGPAPPDDCEARLFDVCIVGSGAAGSVAAHELVAAGLDVVMLEQGPFVSAATEYADSVKDSELAYVRLHSGCWSLAGYPWTSCNVGGGTVFYGGASFRYRAIDFDASRHFPEADLPVAWPYDYRALEPYYEEIERLLGVAADPAADPTAPHSRAAAPMPPVEPSAAGVFVRDAARSLGLRPFPTPLAIATVPYRGRAACARSSPCIEHRCAGGAKGDVARVLLGPLLATPRGFELFAGMRAVRLERSRREHAERVVALRVDTGRVHRFRARHFVIACSAIESAALLLRSADAFGPEGLGNERGMVGRGLCFKMSERVVGFRSDRDPASPRDARAAPRHGPFSTISITDHYTDPAAPGGLGGLVYEAQSGAGHAFLPDEHALRLECILGDRPARMNRVRLARDRDRHGLPRLMMDYTPHPKDTARLAHMIERCEEILRAAGCRQLSREGKDARLGACHLHGTCRGGDDPGTSVVDAWSRVHTVDNVHVLDGAFMPYPGGVNPTLTIQAHALRCARALARDLGKRSSEGVCG